MPHVLSVPTDSRPLTVQQLETLDTIVTLERANGSAWLGSQGSRARSLERRGLVWRREGSTAWRTTTEGHALGKMLLAVRALRKFFRCLRS